MTVNKIGKSTLGFLSVSIRLVPFTYLKEVSGPVCKEYETDRQRLKDKLKDGECTFYLPTKPSLIYTFLQNGRRPYKNLQ